MNLLFSTILLLIIPSLCRAETAILKVRFYVGTYVWEHFLKEVSCQEHFNKECCESSGRSVWVCLKDGCKCWRRSRHDKTYGRAVCNEFRNGKLINIDYAETGTKLNNLAPKFGVRGGWKYWIAGSQRKRGQCNAYAHGHGIQWKPCTDKYAYICEYGDKDIDACHKLGIASETGLQLAPIGHSCFAIQYGSKLSSTNAQNMCSKQNGHLAFITNEIQSKLKKDNYLKSYFNGRQYHIGLKRTGKHWVWDKGNSSFRAINIPWSSGQPNNQNEKCAIIHNLAGFHDLPCDSPKHYICEYELNCEQQTEKVVQEYVEEQMRLVNLFATKLKPATFKIKQVGLVIFKHHVDKLYLTRNGKHVNINKLPLTVPYILE